MEKSEADVIDCDPEMRDRPSDVSSGIVPRLAANSLRYVNECWIQASAECTNDSRVELVVIHIIYNIIVKIVFIILIRLLGLSSFLTLPAQQ